MQTLADSGPDGAVVADAIMGAFPASVDGYRLKRSVSVSARTGTAFAKVDIYNKNGKYVGEMERAFPKDAKSVVHSYFTLDKSVRGAGLGYKLFKQGVDSYTDAGLKTLSVSAVGGVAFNGGYTWGRFGFRFSYASTAEHTNKSFGSYLSSLGVAESAKQRILGRLAKSNRPGDYAKVVAVLPDGRRFHAGKEFMAKQSWEGTFDLRKGSADRKYMNGYQKTSAKIRSQLDAHTR